MQGGGGGGGGGGAGCDAGGWPKNSAGSKHPQGSGKGARVAGAGEVVARAMGGGRTRRGRCRTPRSAARNAIARAAARSDSLARCQNLVSHGRAAASPYRSHRRVAGWSSWVRLDCSDLSRARAACRGILGGCCWLDCRRWRRADFLRAPEGGRDQPLCKGARKGVICGERGGGTKQRPPPPFPNFPHLSCAQNPASTQCSQPLGLGRGAPIHHIRLAWWLESC